MYSMVDTSCVHMTRNLIIAVCNFILLCCCTKFFLGTLLMSLIACLIWFCWATIGMGFPLFNAFLPQYLQHAGKDMPPTPTRVVYRNYAITSIIGVPGSVIAYYTVNIKYIGRKYTIAIATFLTGLILFLFTLSPNPNFQLVMTSLEAFFQNIMYGVLYA